MSVATALRAVIRTDRTQRRPTGPWLQPEFIDKQFALRYARDMRLSGRKPSPITLRWTQRPRIILLGLIGLNVAVFVTQLFLDAYQPGFVRQFTRRTKSPGRARR